MDKYKIITKNISYPSYVFVIFTDVTHQFTSPTWTLP